MSNSVIITALVIAALFALILLGKGALMWMVLVTGSEPTPAQKTLIQLADWTVKSAVGALLGFVGGVGLTKRNEPAAG